MEVGIPYEWLCVRGGRGGMRGHHVRGFYLGMSGDDVCPEIVFGADGWEWTRKKEEGGTHL